MARFGGASWNQGKKRPDLTPTPTDIRKILCPQDDEKDSEGEYELPKSEMIDYRRRIATFVG